MAPYRPNEPSERNIVLRKGRQVNERSVQEGGQTKRAREREREREGDRERVLKYMVH